MSIVGKKGTSVITGYRYYFSVLAGICRGPVDEVFLISSGGINFFDGSQTGPQLTANQYDPASPYSYTSAVTTVGGYAGGVITDNAVVPLSKPNLFGGDKGEGGLDGILWLYMGAKEQVIAAGDYIRTVMAGLRLSDMRGVVTAFFDGEVTANNPYPKAWQYRVRRTVNGWDGDVWYPETAVIWLTDPTIPRYTRGVGDTGATMTTVIYDDTGGLSGGESTGSGTVTTVTSTYSGGKITTYTSGTGTTTTYAVPLEYNQIKAMNPAHIIYECVTNRDWGRGLDRALVDNVSFTDAANRLYAENFGLCMKWSRSEDVDTFIQTVINHIGATVYTDKITGLLCLRLIRAGYDNSTLPIFSYTSGLLEVTSIDTASNDAIANEIIVKYQSPVLNTQKEARAQNIASINQLGSVFSLEKDYAGLPTATLALQVAQRDLKINAGGFKRVEFKLDRRAYSLVPGDVIILSAPDRGFSSLTVRVATVEDTAVTDGSITVVGAQDIFSWPETAALSVVPEPSTFLEIDRSPKPITKQAMAGASYRDAFKGLGDTFIGELSTEAHKTSGAIVFVAAAPTPSSLNYEIQTAVGHYGSFLGPFEDDGTSRFSLLSVTTAAIGVYDTVVPVTGQMKPGNLIVGTCIMLTAANETYFTQEYTRLDAVAVDTTTGITYLTLARGCVDTPALPHPKGTYAWSFDNTGAVVVKEFLGSDLIGARGLTQTLTGRLDPSLATPMYGSTGGTVLWSRVSTPYSGADFRINGYPRDDMPTITGDLVCTWKHRNRILQADTLVGEAEAEVIAETNVRYGIQLVGSGGAVTAHGMTSSGSSGFTGHTFTITAAEILAAGIGSGPMRVTFQTGRPDPLFAGLVIPSYRYVVVDFYWSSDGTPPVTPPPTGTGFSYDFSNNFSP